MINIVYLKRDLRFVDNQLFSLVEQKNLDYRIIYIFDHFLLESDHSDIRHLQFVY
ncbi:MAG: hypothetical protein NZL96_02465 [Patescibacteria group bacterium]|nr:hypothetical protein [Patescibacteria group bacterium]